MPPVTPFPRLVHKLWGSVKELFGYSEQRLKWYLSCVKDVIGAKRTEQKET